MRPARYKGHLIVAHSSFFSPATVISGWREGAHDDRALFTCQTLREVLRWIDAADKLAKAANQRRRIP